MVKTFTIPRYLLNIYNKQQKSATENIYTAAT